MNNNFKSLLDANKPSSIVRIGNSEGFFLLNDFLKKPLKVFEQCISYSGLFKYVAEDLMNNTNERDKWLKLNYESIEDSDILGFVDISREIKNNNDFLNMHCNNKPLFFDNEILYLDPGFLQDLLDPWTRKLKGKKVLVISNFEKTINHQWNNIEKVWGSKLEDIAPFNLVKVIRSPFHPQIDSRQYVKNGSYSDTIEVIKNLMEKEKYDVALIGSGSLAPPLSTHAKKMGKVGITICGSLQLYFGILGSRWFNNPNGFHEWHKMYNQHWIWPMQEDLPEKQSGVHSGKISYWK